MKYKRYIVFSWEVYGNGSPIPDVSCSFDSKKDAEDEARKSISKHRNDYSQVFDCEEREMVSKFIDIAYDFFEDDEVRIGHEI